MKKPNRTGVLVHASIWRWILVSAMMFFLVLSLATRTFRTTVPHGITVQSGVAHAMRQHLDRDAVRFARPAPVVAALQAPTFYPYVAPAGPPLGVLLLDESLSNRPPPSC